MKLVSRPLILSLVLMASAGVRAQSMPYADADNFSQAAGMMGMTISLVKVMQDRCSSQFKELGPALTAAVEKWHAQDHIEIDATKKHWIRIESQQPGSLQKLDEMARQAYEDRVVVPLRKQNLDVANQVVRDYCIQYFDELSSGVWRIRTPNTYKYLGPLSR